MALLAPNIYILQYLEKTKQLTPAVREKAVRFLSSGQALAGRQRRRHLPLPDPSSLPSLSVLRLSEADELQALQRRLQHVRSGTGQHLVRNQNWLQNSDCRHHKQNVLVCQCLVVLPCSQAHRLCAAIFHQSRRVYPHRPGNDGSDKKVGGRETTRQRLLRNGGKSLQQENEGEPVPHSKVVLMATCWSPKGPNGAFLSAGWRV